MGKIFLKIYFTPVMYVPDGQRVMGIILRYVCWGTQGPPPPPGTPAAGQPTHLTPPPLPPSRPPKVFAHGWVSRFDKAAPLENGCAIFCMLSWGLFFIESDGVNRSMCTPTWVPLFVASTPNCC